MTEVSNSAFCSPCARCCKWWSIYPENPWSSPPSLAISPIRMLHTPRKSESEPSNIDSRARFAMLLQQPSLQSRASRIRRIFRSLPRPAPLHVERKPTPVRDHCGDETAEHRQRIDALGSHRDE